MSTKTNRRKFLTTAALATTAYSTSQVMGANEKIRMGFIGLGGRGMGSANWFDAIEDVEVAGLCDVDTKTLARAQQAFPKASSTQDLRKMIEDPEIDAVCVSTGNHWHVLASIWAMEAGKDVYVEKPVSHNVWEGRQLVAAARKYNRMCQGGTQQRSDEFQAELREFLGSGEVLGNIKYARLNRYGMRASIGKLDKPLVPPETVDYDLWLGPAQDIPIYRPKLHYDWHWNWNTGNGDLGNWGPHITDDLRNVVFGDRVKLPTRVMSGGGRLAWDDAGESPNTHFTYFDTDEIPVIFDVHNLPKAKGVKAGDYYARRRTNAFLVVECEGGYYAGGRGGGVAYDADGKSVRKFKGNAGKGHARNFIEAMRNRDREHLNAEVEEIHYSSAWCHLGNVAWRLAEASNYERAKAESMLDYGPWHDVIDDFHKHCAANEIDFANEDVRIGPMLEVDSNKEIFIGESATPEALALLTREYRDGYKVPQLA